MNNMEQKRVSYKIAKALKVSNYPKEDNSITYIYCDGELMSLKVFYSKGRDFEELLNAPTYLDVWLWLWRTKGFYIDIAHYYNSDEVTIWDNNYNKIKSIECMGKYRDPEEVIEKAIEYLVDNDLIK